MPTTINVPCGKCHVCQERRQKEWAFRLEIEYEKADAVQYVTLTYDSEHVPTNEKGELVLNPKHITLFFKRVRERLIYSAYKRYKSIAKDYGNDLLTLSQYRSVYGELAPRIKYFLVGEYGPNGTRRPHYHFLLFGYNLSNAALSDAVRSSWHYGFLDESSAGKGSINYVSGYINKSCVPPSDSVTPVFTRCSANIGIDFLDSSAFASALRDERRYIWRTFHDSNSGKTVSYKVPIPRYYFRKLGCTMAREQYYELLGGAIPVPQSHINGTNLIAKDTLTLKNVKYKLPYDYVLHCEQAYRRLVQRKSTLPKQKQYKLSFEQWLISSLPSRLKSRRNLRSLSTTPISTQMTLDVDRLHSLKKSCLATYLEVRRRHLSASLRYSHLRSVALTSLSTYSLCQLESLTTDGKSLLLDTINARRVLLRRSLSPFRI